ncbi:hypothetical protein C1645_739489 [Glomus cerebriforme]|uniref:Uncharacterized protein n=1 Tax=Glomus cerebriforme TaxID=658196 RepID=A0A397SZU5_9GLOM|nr:hypothetical protein C1645_739489 [Glomus cerebriforme]
MNILKKSKRPLTNLGNSCIIRYRKKIKALENQKKNEQTLLQLLSKKSSQENLSNEPWDIDNQNEGYSKLNASQMVAKILNHGVWFARYVRSWAKAFINYGDIPKDNREHHFKGSSLLDDEDIQLKQKDCNLMVKKNGIYVYVDGHEREDVIAYRKEFLETMEGYQSLMPKFIGEECEIQVNSELEDDECLHIFVIHDKTTFQSNDGQKSEWRPKNEQPLRKKGQGQLIHVSDFLTETIRN